MLSKLQTYSLSELANRVKGELLGNGDLQMKGLCALDVPQPDCLAFVREKRNKKLVDILKTSETAALLIASDSATEEIRAINKSFILVSDPLSAIMDLVPLFYRPVNPAPGISKLADIDPSATVAEDVCIGAFSSVGPNVQIKNGCMIYPHVTIYAGVTIGPKCILHSGVIIREGCVLKENVIVHCGVVIGADGFGYVPDSTTGLRKVPQVGIVEIEGGVEIGANTCIDRGAFGNTYIGKGTKIDNLVQIGHNVQIGNNSILCGQVGIAGSSKIGRNVVMGGNAGLADHLAIGDNCRFAAKAAIITNISEPGDYAGHPAIPAATWRRQMVSLGKLPEMTKSPNRQSKKLRP